MAPLSDENDRSCNKFLVKKFIPRRALLAADVLWPTKVGAVTDCQMFWGRAGDALAVPA